ncbi:MAG TPA: FGGY family carbohydrate kinase, partial [Candidatus Latescibacteria bacterium]|nr:FGGY family carbohydrate kinase [Candidatus Latescibacterota bacterium]
MRSLVIGVDLGTSGVRAVAVDRSGTVVGSAARGYQVHAPYPGYAEQDPEEWWRSTCEALRECVAVAGQSTIEGIGFSGQMHGTVLIDPKGGLVRPAIIWPDQRSGESCRRFVARVGADWLAARTQNSLATGFQLASLLWLSENDPSSLARAFRVLLPKDFIRGRMSGVWATEPSDACSTLAFDSGR